LAISAVPGGEHGASAVPFPAISIACSRRSSARLARAGARPAQRAGGRLEEKWAKVAAMFEQTEADILAF
jgi:hypothetical protein